MQEYIIDAIGWVGSFEVLLAYALVSWEKISSKDWRYQFLNASGSLFLIINTLYYHAYPSTFLNAAWLIVAIFGMVAIFKKK